MRLLLRGPGSQLWACGAGLVDLPGMSTPTPQPATTTPGTPPAKTRSREAYDDAVRAAIAAAPPVSSAERERLSRVWRTSGSELAFEEPGRQAA